MDPVTASIIEKGILSDTLVVDVAAIGPMLTLPVAYAYDNSKTAVSAHNLQRLTAWHPTKVS